MKKLLAALALILFLSAPPIAGAQQDSLKRAIKVWFLLAQGRAEGHAEGDLEARRRLARKLLATGMPLDQVAELVELSPAQIQALSAPRED